MALNIDIDNTTLDIISTRLKNTVSPLNILKWLGNFKKSDREYAIEILSKITVYTTNEIEEILDESFNSFYAEAKNDIIVHPTGEFGKSGSMITYLFQKTTFYKAHKPIKLLPSFKDLYIDPQKKYTLVLLDDFVGSGNTIKKYYLENIEADKDKFDKIYFIGIAGIDSGVRTIKPYFDKILIPPSNIFKKAFSHEASYFGYRKYSPYRELSFRYGKLLTSPSKKKGQRKKYPDALGYENSQGLVSFSYGSPNNSLPMIWANKGGWFPLIPRYSIDKISYAKQIRKNILYELSILKEFGSENLKDNFFSFTVNKGTRVFSSVNHIDFSIYSIIKLSRSGFTAFNICHKLGILYKDYEECLAKGRERGIFDDADKLTLFGLELYDDAKKCIERKKKSFEFEFADHFNIRKITYTPKVFNGKS